MSNPTTGIIDNYGLRYNWGTAQLEMNTGAEVWVGVPTSLVELSLNNGNILIGNASNVAAQQTMSGGATITNAGVVTLAASGASGLLQFSNGTTFASDSNLSWSSTNHQLALTGSSSAPLTITASGSSTIALLNNQNGAGNGGWEVENNNGGLIYTGVYGSAAGGGTILAANAFIQSNTTNLAIFNTVGGIQLAVGGIATSNVALNITSGGSLGMGSGVTPDASAVVDIESTTKGFLPPQMTTTQKNAISSPKEGLTVYDLTLHALCFYNGTAWKTVTAS